MFDYVKLSLHPAPCFDKHSGGKVYQMFWRTQTIHLIQSKIQNILTKLVSMCLVYQTTVK